MSEFYVSNTPCRLMVLEFCGSKKCKFKGGGENEKEAHQ
jgi:hypothetical protein